MFHNLQSVEDLPPREYSTTRDPFVKLSLVKDTRRSLRKKTHLLLEEFRTKTVRHSLHPEFNETFTSEIKISEFKVIIDLMQAMLTYLIYVFFNFEFFQYYRT